jgi:hypothetical protein
MPADSSSPFELAAIDPIRKSVEVLSASLAQISAQLDHSRAGGERLLAAQRCH